MNQRSLPPCLAVLLAIGILFPLPTLGDSRVRAVLDGFETVPTLFSSASGKFAARIREDVIEYSLSYAGFETEVRFAHIHFGRPATNGGVIAFLCASVDAPPGVPPCPLEAGTVSGTITAEGVIGPAEQGIMPGEFDKLAAAINAGAAYVHIHSEAFPPGEIRGQLERGFRFTSPRPVPFPWLER